MVDPAHWEGLPDGHTRATSLEPALRIESQIPQQLEPLSGLLSRRHANITVVARPLTDYANAANLQGLR
jgi:hypothetical protein